MKERDDPMQHEDEAGAGDVAGGAAETSARYRTVRDGSARDRAGDHPGAPADGADGKGRDLVEEGPGGTRLAGDCADDATDIVDVMRALREADTRTKAAFKMHFLDGDSLADTARALGTNRTEVTVWLQPMLDIRNGRGGRGARA